MTPRATAHRVDSFSPRSHDLYFFGCWDRPGHFLWAPLREYVGLRCPDLPVSLQPARVDGQLAPRDAVEQVGRACLHHKDGWTVVAWWDRSEDTRPGSNSALLMRGQHSLQDVLHAARERYPELAARFVGLEEVPH